MTVSIYILNLMRNRMVVGVSMVRNEAGNNMQRSSLADKATSSAVWLATRDNTFQIKKTLYSLEK